MLALGGAALAAWLAVLLQPARPWDLRPRCEGDSPPPQRWPSVCVLVPARNEAALLPQTLPALVAQDYPGAVRVVVVDDRSADGTAAVAAGLGAEVVRGTELPDGWAGKVWALEQGSARCGDAAYLLLTDADIRHAPDSLRTLVAESERRGLGLNSRMARLRAATPVERLLVPAFACFFALLYPMRRVNDPRRRTAAAAGGCVLLRRDALRAIGGFARIRDAVIDDVSLAKAVKSAGFAVRLAASPQRVRSLRAYCSLGPFWRTVRRTAFTQLRHSWLLLALTLALLALVFLAPPFLVAASLAGAASWPAGLLGALAWAAAAVVYLPTLGLYELSPLWAATLPLAGLLYGAMTLDSALRHAAGARGAW